MKVLTHNEVEAAAERLALIIHDQWDLKEEKSSVSLFGVPRGGVPATYLLARALERWYYVHVVDSPDKADFIIDDIIDSGTTQKRYAVSHPDKPFYALFRKSSEWLVFPWEQAPPWALGASGAEDIPLR